MDSLSKSRRKALKVSVAALCTEVGFGVAEESAIETLTEMLQSLLTEIGKSSKAYTELSGRTEVMVTDVLTALIDQGIHIDSIPAYANRGGKTVLISPVQTAAPPIQKVLSAGENQPHPAHIPEHLPPFPDPHTYIRTESGTQPVSEYQLIREKAASYKRDTERALTRFVAKTGETQSLFKDDNSLFPLIAVQTHAQPYLAALLPKDQDLDTLEASDIQGYGRQGSGSRPDLPGTRAQKSETVDPELIDNPYLQPVKLPKYKKYKIS